MRKNKHAVIMRVTNNRIAQQLDASVIHQAAPAEKIERVVPLHFLASGKNNDLRTGRKLLLKFLPVMPFTHHAAWNYVRRWPEFAWR